MVITGSVDQRQSDGEPFRAPVVLHILAEIHERATLEGHVTAEHAL